MKKTFHLCYKNLFCLGACLLLLCCSFTKASAQLVTLLASDGSGSSAFESSTNWSNGLVPTAGNNYFVGPGLVIRTPNDNNVDTFGGDSLTLAGIMDFKQTNLVVVNNLYLTNGTIVNAFAGGPSTNNQGILAGSLIVVTNGIIDPGGDVSAITYMQIQSIVSGNGNLTIQRSNVVTFTATNTYSGPITVVGSTLQLSGTASLTPANLVLESGVFGGSETNSTATNIVQAGGNMNVGYGPTGLLRVGYRTGASTSITPCLGVLNVASQSQFTVNVGEFSVGNNTVDNDAYASVGEAFLATNNTVTATNIFIGDSAFSSATANNQMVLGGGSNYFSTPLLTVGMRKVTGQLILPTGGVFRLDNAGTPATLTVGGENFSTSASSVGTMNVSNGTFIANLGTLTIGTKSGGSSGGATGTLNIGTSAANNISASNVVIGSMAGASGTPLAQGTLNMAGGSFVVTNNVTLGSFDNGNGSASGTLNLNGGKFTVDGNILNGNGSATVNLNGGSLALSNTAGSIGLPLTALNLTSGTLHLNVNGTSSITNVTATTVNASGTTTITIDSVANVSSAVTNALISYTGSDPFSGIVLGTLPSGYSGNLIDNSTAQRIDLSISPSSTPPTPTILSPGVSGTNLMFQITNSQAGFSYVLEATPKVSPVTWTPILTNAGGGTLNFTIPIVSTNAQLFFRILVQ